MAVYAAEVTAEESDMANDAEPDMNETTESDNASEPDKEDKTDRFIYDNSFNGDLSGAVSVIVNRDTESFVAEPAADSTEAENTSEQIFDENTDVSETPVISEQMLYELYTAGRSMKVTGDGYSIIIDGKKIVNYKMNLIRI